MLQQAGQAMRKRSDQGRVDLRAASVWALRRKAVPAVKGARKEAVVGPAAPEKEWLQRRSSLYFCQERFSHLQIPVEIGARMGKGHLRAR